MISFLQMDTTGAHQMQASIGNCSAIHWAMGFAQITEGYVTDLQAAGLQMV